MKFFIVAVALVHAVSCGHVAVRMPFLNPAGVTYTSYGQISSYGQAPSYDYGEQALAYGNAYAADAHAQAAYAGEALYQNVHHQQVAVAKAPVAVGYAQVPVKAAVAVPTVHHVPAVADVPYTKIEAQPAVVQKIVDVAKPAIKTRKYEVRFFLFYNFFLEVPILFVFVFIDSSSRYPKAILRYRRTHNHPSSRICSCRTRRASIKIPKRSFHRLFFGRSSTSRGR